MLCNALAILLAYARVETIGNFTALFRVLKYRILLQSLRSAMFKPQFTISFRTQIHRKFNRLNKHNIRPKVPELVRAPSPQCITTKIILKRIAMLKRYRLDFIEKMRTILELIQKCSKPLCSAFPLFREKKIYTV